MLTSRMAPPHEFRHMSSGSLSIPTPTAGNGSAFAGAQPAPAPGPAHVARSPPNKQNTSHVPCKFFRQGACQAGNSCPFSHDLAATNDNICKYFNKGNCKFGPKCANAHILPDGRRVNYKGGPMGVGGHLNIGARVAQDQYHVQSSALTNSFHRANGVPPSPFGQQYSPFTATSDSDFPPLHGRQQSVDVPAIDTVYASQPTSNYGSPSNDDLSRLSLGLSPVQGKGLSVLDAPLPASFDSQGISYIARHGPIASSMPSRFGSSPPGSVGTLKDGKGSEALKNLRTSAFGDDTRDRFNGTSPSTLPAEEYFGKRAMHSQRTTKPKVISASLPKPDEHDWPADFPFEEDFLPDVLKDLMTPQEKARRDSRNADDGGRPILHSGANTPINDAGSKWGSPSNASPSRWGPLFQRHKEEEEKAASRASAFGHVGSPLRNSSLHPGASPTTRQTSSGDMSPYLASPPRSTSILSQQFNRLSTGSDSGLHPVSASRASSNPIGSGSGRSTAERQVSSSSIGGSGRFTTPIDEEQGEFVFDMEGVDEKKEKRNSGGGWTYPVRNSPPFGAVGSGKSGLPTTNGTGNIAGLFSP